MSHSENKPKTTQTSTTNVSNLNIQDTEGVTIANSHGVQVQVTDFNALENARDIAESAIAGGVDVFDMAAELGIESIDHSRETFAIGTEAVLQSLTESLDFGRDALDVAEGATRLSLTEALDFGRDALDVTEGATRLSITESLDFARDAIDFQGSQISAATQAALDAGLDYFSESLSFAGAAGSEALDAGLDYFSESLGFAGAAGSEALEAGRGFFELAIDAAAGALKAAQDQVADTTAALGAIAKEQSTSEAARLQQVTLYALAAVALVVIFGRARG